MRPNALFAGLVAGLVLLVGVRPGAQEPGAKERKLEITFDNGYVTLVAQNVTVRDIFAKWAQVGGTTIVNAEQLTSEPLNLQFDKTLEISVVESLIRLSKAKGAGYVAGPRPIDAPAAASRLARIQILPRSNPSTTYSSTATQIGSMYPQTSPDDEIPPVTPLGPGPAAQQPQPQPQTAQPNRGPGVYVPPTGPVPIVGTGRGGEAPPAPGTTGRVGGGGQ